MPDLSAAGELFTLDAAAGFDGGVVRGKVGAGARMGFDARFALCHGLDAALSAQALAEVDAALRLLWVIGGRGQGQAVAAAGVQLEARLTVDLFDQFGLSAEAAAFAEASVAGRLAIQLDVQEVAAAAATLVSGLSYELVIAALNELAIEAGVWGKASFAAMAKAHLNLRGSLRDDTNAGFIVEMGTELGLGAGAGYEFFAGLRFANPKRFFLTASELVAQALAVEAERRLPSHLRPAAAWLRLALPVALNAAYTLGQTLATEALSGQAQLPQRFVDTFVAQLQRFVLDGIAQAAPAWLAGVLDEATAALHCGALDAAQRDALITTVEAALAQLRTDAAVQARLTPQAVVALAEALAPLLLELQPDDAGAWRQPLTLGWSALVAVQALRQGLETLGAHASAGAIGLSTAASSASVVFLPQPPAILQPELERFFGALPPQFELRHAIDYIAGSGVAPLLAELLPDLAPLLGALSRELGITPGAVVEAALQGAAGGSLADSALYLALREVMRQAIDGHICGDLLPALRATLGPQDDARIWIDEVAEPSLKMTSEFVFGELDRLVGIGPAVLDSAAFGNTLRTGFSVLAGKLVVRQAVVLGDILIQHVLSNVHGGLLALQAQVRADAQGATTAAAVTLAAGLLPTRTPVPPGITEATRQLLGELLGAAADACGPGVWTDLRRSQLRELLQRLLLSVDGAARPVQGRSRAELLAQIFECAYVPDPGSLMALHQLQMDVLADQAERMLPRVCTALGEFFLRLTLELYDELDRAAREFIELVAALAQAAWDELQRLRALLQQRLVEWQAASRALAQRVQEAADILRQPARRNEVLDRLKLDGMQTAEALARAVPGFNQLPAWAQRDAVALAVGLFATAFEIVRPALNEGLKALGKVGDDLADLIDAAATLPDLLAALADAAAQRVRAGVNDALAGFGVALPPELSVGDVVRGTERMLDALQPLRAALEQALQAQVDEREAQALERLARDRRDAQAQRLSQEQARQRELLGDHIDVRIVSPVALTDVPARGGRAPWAYGARVPLRIHIDGARPSFVQPDAPRRVLLALNGQPLLPSPGAWVFAADVGQMQLDLEVELSAADNGLRAGVNVLECSVAHGVQTVARRQVLFAVDPAATLRAQVVVDADLSLFDTLGDDHEHTPQEQLTLRNIGTATAALQGWTVADRVGHRYAFGAVTLLPGSTLSLHTGPGRDREGELFWGRRQAVWNNRGDTVFLRDADGGLQQRFDY